MTGSDPKRGSDGRFKKGQSGNPKGRPKKTHSASVPSSFDVLLERTLTIIRNGKPVEVSADIALQYKVYKEATNGNLTARKSVMKMIKQRDAWLRKNARQSAPNAIDRKIEPVDPENANAAMLLLGIATVDESRLDMAGHTPPLLLESWAAQAALSRRRGGSALTDRDISEIERCTRDSDTLRWPRRYTDD